MPVLKKIMRNKNMSDRTPDHGSSTLAMIAAAIVVAIGYGILCLIYA